MLGSSLLNVSNGDCTEAESLCIFKFLFYLKLFKTIVQEEQQALQPKLQELLNIVEEKLLKNCYR